jgi:hypothetical protein
MSAARQQVLTLRPGSAPARNGSITLLRSRGRLGVRRTGSSRRATEIALELEEPTREANTLLQAISLMRLMRDGSGGDAPG